MTRAPNRLRSLFGRRLRAIRKLRGLTQEQLGEGAGVSGKLVGQIERGAGNPTLEVIGGLANALGLTPPALFKFEEDRPEGTPRHAARALAAEEQVARYLSGRPAGEVERALRILEAALGDVPTVR